MPTPRQRADRFRYDRFDIEPATGSVTLRYSTDGHEFVEHYTFGPEGDWEQPATAAAVRLLFLMAGVSYYKTAAARVIDLGDYPTTASERASLLTYFQSGLAEFAYRNGIDLGDLAIEGPDGPDSAATAYVPWRGGALIPFGGGIDSIVTVSDITSAATDAALFIVHPPGDRFTAIEDAAAVTGLPVIHVARELSPRVRRSEELGFFNGHVPITAVITATAVVAAVLNGRDAVVLSNEWPASVPTLLHDGRPVNHQWSKSAEFEALFADLVATQLGSELSVFSYLRNRTELWVAQRFSELTEFHQVFRSCNRSFHQDPSERLSTWCGECDKCCFIDLILAPFMEASDLRSVFSHREPLENPQLEDRFLTLLDLSPDARPFECVGDVNECRAALRLAAARPDRKGSTLLQSLLAALDSMSFPVVLDQDLFQPIGTHSIPDRYAPTELLD